jgi:hypothetical protein
MRQAAVDLNPDQVLHLKRRTRSDGTGRERTGQAEAQSGGAARLQDLATGQTLTGAFKRVRHCFAFRWISILNTLGKNTGLVW